MESIPNSALKVLKSSELLEVLGEGRDAMVRRKENFSRQANESEEQASWSLGAFKLTCFFLFWMIRRLWLKV